MIGLTFYQFKLSFIGATNYIRIPLAVFASKDGSDTCQLQVTKLSDASSEIILGGMFFQEFFGAFTNSYKGTTHQSASIYIGRNSLFNETYVGSQILPIGDNPFNQSSTGGLGAWAIVGIIVGIGVVIALLALVVHYKRKSEANTRADNIVYNEEIAVEQPLVKDKGLLNENE